jgi:hypothetical protein
MREFQLLIFQKFERPTLTSFNLTHRYSQDINEFGNFRNLEGYDFRIVICLIEKL